MRKPRLTYTHKQIYMYIHFYSHHLLQIIFHFLLLILLIYIKCVEHDVILRTWHDVMILKSKMNIIYNKELMSCRLHCMYICICIRICKCIAYIYLVGAPSVANLRKELMQFGHKFNDLIICYPGTPT